MTRRSNTRQGSITFLATMLALVLMWPAAYAGESEDIADWDLESLLDEVVVSASKHAETLSEAPANVFVSNQGDDG